MKDSQSTMVYHYLQPWLQGNIVLVELDFNFEQGIDKFQSCLNCMLDQLENGNLKEYRQIYSYFLVFSFLFDFLSSWACFFILVAIHSYPKLGFLHVAQNMF